MDNKFAKVYESPEISIENPTDILCMSNMGEWDEYTTSVNDQKIVEEAYET